MTNTLPSNSHRMAMLISLAISIVIGVILSGFLVSPAQALVTDKTTAQGNNATKDVVLGGVSTRITWEGTVDDDETLASLLFTFPSGTSVSEDTTVDCVALDGLDRITTPYTYTIDNDGMTVIFDDPVEAGSLVRVMIYRITPPSANMVFQMGVSYTTGTGEEYEIENTPGISIEKEGVVQRIVNWLDEQEWVEAWNSVTFLRLFFNPQIAVQAVPSLFNGWLLALGLVLIGFPLAIPLGFGLAMMRMSRFRVVRGIASVYVNIMRGTPLFLQIYIYFFGLPMLGITINSFVLGFFALALNSCAYLCEIFRAAIQSIPRGQFEASRSLGMTGFQTMMSVIVPQSVRRVIPTATSEFISLYKDTSLLASVGVMEIMMFSRSLVATTGNITPYIVCACYYLIVTLPLTRLISYFEKRLSVADGMRPATEQDQKTASQDTSQASDMQPASDGQMFAETVTVSQTIGVAEGRGEHGHNE